jgi:hypothetical protein
MGEPELDNSIKSPRLRSPILAGDLDSILSFLPRIEALKPSEFSHLTAEINPNGALIGTITQDQVVDEFRDALIRHGYVRQFDWPSWESQAEGFHEKPARLKAVNLKTCVKLLTLHVRKDRFCEGHFAVMLADRHICAILRRMRQLRGWLLIGNEGSAPIDINGIAFDVRFKDVLQKVIASINDPFGDGNTPLQKCYPLPAMKELRGALQPPIQSGKKKAAGVFVRVLPLRRPVGIRITHKRQSYDFYSPADFNEDQIRQQVRTWALGEAKPKRPKSEREFGDGIALPGGQFESDRSKH